MSNHNQMSYITSDDGNLLISFKEYVVDIIPSTSDFQTLNKIELNPGIASTFPILSRFAALFEEYEFTDLKFEYKPLIDGGNLSAGGAVILCPHYNAAANEFTSKQAMENTNGTLSCSVVEPLALKFRTNTAFGNGCLYTRYNQVTQQEKCTYDIGFLQIATRGCVPNIEIGELWIHYTVRLSRLRLHSDRCVEVGDGFMATVTHRPRTEVNYNERSIFGTSTDTLLLDIQNPGLFGYASYFTCPSKFTQYTITNQYNANVEQTANFKITFDVESGQKYLLMLVYLGRSSYGIVSADGSGMPPPIDPAELEDPLTKDLYKDIAKLAYVISGEPDPSQASTIDYTSTYSISLLKNSVTQDRRQPPDPDSTYAESVTIKYLIEISSASIIQSGTFNLSYNFKWNYSIGNELNSRANGNTTLSLTRVSQTYTI